MKETRKEKKLNNIQTTDCMHIRNVEKKKFDVESCEVVGMAVC